MPLTEEKNIGISIARFLGFLLVVSSHFFLAFHNGWSLWLNVGVQVFIAISGFLYGSRDKTYDVRWLISRARRILFDYYIFLFCIVMLYLALGTYRIDALALLKNIFCLQGFSEGIPNVGHLWYISYVVVFYLMTPLLLAFLRKTETFAPRFYWYIVFALSVILMLPSIRSDFPVKMQWIVEYILAFAFGRYRMRQNTKTQRVDKIAAFCSYASAGMTTLLCFLLWWRNGINGETNGGLLQRVYNLSAILAHISIGFSLLLFCLWAFRRTSGLPAKSPIRKFLDASDRYSFPMYITHHIFIIGPYSLLGRTPFLLTDILFILLVTVLSGVLLYTLSNSINKFMQRLTSRKKKPPMSSNDGAKPDLKRKPKLLITASTFPRWRNDSEPRFILDLAKALLLYFDVTVLAPAAPSLKTNESIEGVTVIRFHYFPIRKFESLCYPGAIIGRIHEKKYRILLVPFLILSEWITVCRISRHYDIVNAHWVIPQGILQSFVRAPYVVTCHGDDILSLNRAPIRALKIRALRRSRRIIAISRVLADRIHEWLPDRTVTIQSMGCDCSQFLPNAKPTQLLAPFDGVTVLFVGRLVRLKGADILIRAVAGTSRIRLVIVGDGPLAGELKDMAKPLGERIIFLGSRDHSELPGIYTACDIFCIPSLSEGLGLVTLEAMASGVCVTGSRVGGIPEIIRHEENGLLFAPGSVAEISEALLRLAADPDLRRRLSGAAFETVRRYDYSIIGEKYASVLLDALKAEKPL